MPKAALPLPVLTDNQKALLESYWYEDADALLKRLWPDRDNLNKRTIHWKAAKLYLASIGKDPEASAREIKTLTAKELPALTGEQEEFIKASYKDASGPVEVARLLYENDRLMPGSAEVRLVTAYIRKIDPKYRREDEECEDVDYQPPRTQNILIGRLNRYGIGQRPDGRKLGDGGLSGQEQKQVEALLSHLRKSVFKVEADKFTKKIDRDVFEETFLSTCWDKPDLTPEHVLQYIQLASLSAQRNATDRMMRTLDERFMVSLEDPTQRLSKTEVDALKETKGAAAEHLKQINGLIRTLTGERAKIAAKEREGTASMHPLVAAWKNEEDRKRLIAFVEKKQQADLKREVERFSTMDSIRAELWGIDPDTIIH